MPLLDTFDPDWLRCLAHLGHAPARQHLGPDAPPPADDLRDWLLTLDTWGDEICVRALLALAPLRDQQSLPIPRNGIPAAAALIACPCQDHERKARRAWSEDAPWSGEFDWAELLAEQGWEVAWKGSADAVREALAEALVPWVLKLAQQPAEAEPDGSGPDAGSDPDGPDPDGSDAGSDAAGSDANGFKPD